MKNCRCGFGGEGHTGNRRSLWNTVWERNLPNQPWHKNDDDRCWPTKCPVCHNDVFFVRYNGGSVWFNHLGQPWPKHDCFYQNPVSDPTHITAETISYDTWLSYLEWGVGNLKYLRSHSYLNKLCQVSNGATLITDMTYGLYLDGVAATHDEREINRYSEVHRSQFIEQKVCQAQESAEENFIKDATRAAISNLRQEGVNEDEIKRRLLSLREGFKKSNRLVQIRQSVGSALRLRYEQKALLLSHLAEEEAGALTQQNRGGEASKLQRISRDAARFAEFETRFEQSFRVIVVRLNTNGDQAIEQSFFTASQKLSGSKNATEAYSRAIERFGSGDAANALVYLVGPVDKVGTKLYGRTEYGCQPLKNNVGAPVSFRSKIHFVTDKIA